MRCLTTHKPKSGARRRMPSALLVSVLGLVMALGGACASGDEGETSDMSAPAPAATEAAATQSGSDISPSSDAAAESFGGADMSVDEGPMAEEESAESSPAGPESLDSPASAAGAVLAVPTALTPADIGRDIIYRATVTVEADDVAAATREAVAIVQGLGGIVFGQQTTTEPRPRASLTFKVLPADFPTALERLAGVGALVDQRVSTDDVTERIVDLESRIITAEASVDRLRKFLQEAVVLENVARLERELLDRETTLETLRGQLRTLRGQVDLATITLTIEQSPEVRPDTGILVTAWVTAEEDGDPCLGDREIDIETGDTLRFCLEVENRGEAALTDVRVRSEALRRRVDSFSAVEGGFDRIESGEILVAVLEEPVTDGRLAGRVATRGLNVSIGATATPVGADGAGLPEISDDSVLFVNVVEPPEPDSPPVGFTDAVGAGAGALVAAARVVAVIAGALLPFLPIIAAVAAGVWWLRRRSNRRSEGI